MARTILIHQNVQVPDDDDRTADQIKEAVDAAIEVGSDHESVRGLVIEAVLWEEV